MRFDVLLLIIFLLKNVSSLSMKLDKIKWTKNPDLTLEWKNKKINYINYSSDHKQALLLIHGFGSSLYHWRYNIKELSKHYDVYAFDLIGFGKSSKNIHDYDINLWKEQSNYFINTIIKKETVVIGNSLGGYVALNSWKNNYVNGIILLNGYVDFNENKKKPSKITLFITKIFTRFYFYFMKRENQIENTLKMLYPEDNSKVDSKLITSIIEPTKDKYSLQVLDKIVYGFLNSNGISKKDFIEFDKPMLLVKGTLDNWIDQNTIDKIIELCPKSKSEYISSGHCPQDEKPIIINNLISDFIKINIL